MADVNANIGVNIDTSGALAQLKLLQREISRFHTSVAKSSDAAGLAQRDLQKNFINGVNAIQGFSAELRTVKTTAENFTDSLERNKFSMREYFRYSAASTKTFGRFFKSEFDTINKVAVENVKRLQTQYIKMGRDANGTMKSIAIMPTKLDMSNMSTQIQMAAQKQALFNQLVKQGSTNLLNFGKNTQWAGRQLMVGFTIPLIGLGSVASKTFMDMETAAIKFRKVYGDLFTPTEESQFALESIQALGREFTKYGIAVSQTVSLAAEAAAAGFSGADLQAQVTQATRLQILGQVEQQQALETTISLQNAFRISSNDLADAINFLNAVENQTVVSLEDITIAIPKAAPIVRELGGDVKDLAFFMAAMKEGGINASQGANALKSGLASLINPSEKASGMLKDLGIDINDIVERNVGNLKGTVIEFAQALDGLSNLSRQRAIEQLFGKFQQARLSALFDNVIRDGNQASRVLDLASASTADLASLAEKELGITADSAMNKFRASVEQLKVSLVPLGQAFLEVITPLLQKLNGLIDWFNNLSDTSKKVITKVLFYVGGLGPILLMTIGLLANFVANGIKGLLLLRTGFLRLTGQSQVLSEQTNFLTVQQQNALAAAASLEQAHMNLQQTFNGEAGAIRQLINEYQRMIVAQNTAASRFPGMMAPGFKPRGYRDGVVSVPGPKGAGDIIPAMLAPGESVIPADMTQKYGGLINGMISDSIPGFSVGLEAPGVPNVATGRVINPNTFVSAHFSDYVDLDVSQMQSMLDLPGLTDSLKRLIQNAIDAGTNLRLYTDSVIALTAQMNQDLKNNEADVETLRTLITSNLEGTHIELVRRLQQAGVPQAQINAIATNISQDILASLPTAGNIGEGEFNSIVRGSYERASANDPAVSQAYDEMQQFTTIGDPVARGGRQQRVGISSGVMPTDIGDGIVVRGGSYKNKRKIFGNIVEQSGGTYEKDYYLNSQVENVIDSAIDTAATTAGVKSPSTRTIPIGEDIARGVQVGMENQMQATRDVAANVSNTAVSGLIDPKTGKPFGIPDIASKFRLTGSEVAGMAKPLILPGQQDPGGPLILPGQQQGSSGPLIIPNGQAPSGPIIIPSGTKSPSVAEELLEEPLMSVSEALQEGAEEVKKTTRFSKTRGVISKGVGKITGAGGGFGLSGLVFALSMLPGKFGELAKSITPVIFGLQSLSMLSRVIGPIPTLIVATGVAYYQINKELDKAAEQIAESARLEAEARHGSVQSIEQYAEFTGKALPSAREFTRNNRQLISASGEAVKRAKEFLAQEGNRSTQVINRAAMRSPNAGLRAAAVDVAQRAAVLGMEPGEIAANIKAAADLIGADQVKLTAQVQKMLAPNGEDILTTPLTVEARIKFLSQQAEKQISTIQQDIAKIGEVNFGKDVYGKELEFNELQRRASAVQLRNEAQQQGGFGGFLKRVAAESAAPVGRTVSSYQDEFASYESLQRRIQAATIQVSVSFKQQTEALALLNAQYADGLISKEDYSAQLAISSENFYALGNASKDLITSLDEIDDEGNLSAAALKDLGNEAFAALKKSNPELFKKIAKSMEDLDSAAQIDIMMGYAQGSLTILDVARLPEVLDLIDGKTVEAAIKILAENNLSSAFTEPQLRDGIKDLEKQLAGVFPGGPEGAKLKAEFQRQLKYYRSELAKIEDMKGVGQGRFDGEGAPLEDTGDGDGKFEAFKKELAALKKKLSTLQDINKEMDRQNQYQMKQMDLINQASRAKISGNFLEAAQLQQQSMLEGAKFTRESQEIQLERLIDRVSGRAEKAEDRGGYNTKDLALLKQLRAKDYESIIPTPSTPGVGFNSRATGFAGSNTNIGGTMYTVTMNISGENADQIANKVMNKLQVLGNKKNKTNKVR